MNNLPETLLQESLDLLEQGESIEQILARYPQFAADLRPFLETAVQLATLVPQPSLAAKRQSQKAFLAHAESLKVSPVRPSPWYRLRQILLPIASLAVVLILFGMTAVSVSGSAIPGDALYPIKRLVENVRLNQANDPETAVTVAEQLRQERIREVQDLLRAGRVAEATFQGEVEAIQPGAWLVATIPVTLDENTQIEGEPQLGELAEVNGRTEDGIFTATSIKMLTGSATTPEASPTPDPSAQPTVEPTSEPTAALTTTPTATPTKTATIAPSPTPQATKSPTLVPTATPTASPTATPVPTQPPSNNNGDDGDNNNDNGDDGDNDNDDNDNDNDDNVNDNSGGNENDNDNDNDNDNSGGGDDDDDNDNDDDDD